jgi:hypothetical protein
VIANPRTTCAIPRPQRSFCRPTRVLRIPHWHASR